MARGNGFDVGHTGPQGHGRAQAEVLGGAIHERAQPVQAQPHPHGVTEHEIGVRHVLCPEQSGGVGRVDQGGLEARVARDPHRIAEGVQLRDGLGLALWFVRDGEVREDPLHPQQTGVLSDHHALDESGPLLHRGTVAAEPGIDFQVHCGRGARGAGGGQNGVELPPVEAQADVTSQRVFEVRGRGVQPREHGGGDARVTQGHRLGRVRRAEHVRPGGERRARHRNRPVAVRVRLDHRDQRAPPGEFRETPHVVLHGGEIHHRAAFAGLPGLSGCHRTHRSIVPCTVGTPGPARLPWPGAWCTRPQ